MSHRISLFQMIRRSIMHRRARSLSALLAMTISAAVATALLTLYTSLDAKLHHEFRGFGANIVITPAKGEKHFADGTLDKVQALAGPDANAAEFGYAVATTDRGTPVVVAGTDFAAVRRLDSWWQVTAWPTPAETSSALLGQHAAQFIGDENNVQLTFADRPITLHGAGRLNTGGDEDNRIYMPLASFTAWTGALPSVIELQVPGGAAQVESVIGDLRKQLPGIKVDPVRQLVEGENRIVDKTHALMYAAMILIALTVAISVLATLSASVLERRRDFALMKALGSSTIHMVGLFVCEAVVLSIGGVMIGYILGSGASSLISQLNFHTATMPRLSVLPAILLLNVSIAVLAALLPVRLLRGLQPAALLKGE
ncbi:MAG: ABC transporter permease [Edaphobacter sp.]|uniref:ABC transporter permease n=1 Tax=Edaphobacter sp. TaxID=1934404 RepID=UPI0023A15119|nr:ABC transporter permease [Edaphobacter sp.]MDE1175426.1 ABC transporter permease [Edaphobacter sp.]